MGLDTIRINRLEQQVETYKQRGDSALSLVAVGEQKIALYQANEAILRKQLGGQKTKRVFAGIITVATAVLAVVLFK